MKKLLSSLLILFVSVLILNLPVIAEETEDYDEEDTVEVTSAIITALSCAEKAKELEEFEIISVCPPKAAWEGVKDIYTEYPKIVVFDVTEGEYYYVKPTKDSIYYSDLLEGFGGSIDGEGVIVGEIDGVAVVKFEDFEITPKPKPGFFKGCL
ncbi:hypothetical protein [Persephonella sp.]